MRSDHMIGFSTSPRRVPLRPVEPRVLRLYPTFSIVRTCRMADGRDRDSELIEVEW